MGIPVYLAGLSADLLPEAFKSLGRDIAVHRFHKFVAAYAEIPLANGTCNVRL